MTSDLFRSAPPTVEPAPCPHCRCALSGLHGIYDEACAGCRARHIAASPVFFNAKYAVPKDDGYEAARQAYRDALAAANVTHAEVTTWARV